MHNQDLSRRGKRLLINIFLEKPMIFIVIFVICTQLLELTILKLNINNLIFIACFMFIIYIGTTIYSYKKYFKH